jgi:uncharacterized protein (TIGR02145 family)
MKTNLSFLIALFFTIQLISAQDTLYVYKAGVIVYKSALTTVDSLSFTNKTTSPDILSDIDGNSYLTKTFGSQTWMVENLKTSKYRNGEIISNLTETADWQTTKQGALCNYNNDAANGIKYGKLYNWFAVNDPRSIAPVGWHVATDADWTTLEAYVSTHYGSSLSTAKALASTTEWPMDGGSGTIGNNPSINNFSGFNALSGGFRCYTATFYNQGDQTRFWTSTSLGETIASMRYLYFNNNYLGVYNSALKNVGFSIRCVKD